MTGGDRFATFCRTYLRQSKGRWANQPLELEPWQRTEITDPLFAVGRGRSEDGRRYLRKHREALIGLPRKNGKSTLCSAIALYLLIADGEPGAEVYSAAASKDQAKIVFQQAREMVEQSPALLDFCKVYRNEIVVPATHSVYRVIAADAPRQHGLNPSGVIIDELHAHRDPELYYALRTALKAREQPLLVSITTAGHDLDTVCGEVYLRGRASPGGFMFRWLEVDEGRLDDPLAWKEANPASWITPESLMEDARDLPRGVFERLHLNRWTSAEDLWLPRGSWLSCKSDIGNPIGEPPASMRESRVYIGVDLGLKHDTAAVGWAMPRDDGTILVGAHVWGLHPDPSKPAPPCHTLLREDRLPIHLVRDYIKRLRDELGGRVREVAYDPYRFEDSAQMLEGEGFWMVECPQTDTRMVPATSGLYQAVMERRITHDGDPVIAQHVENVAAEHTQSGWRMKKKKATRPMDAAVAMAIAYLSLVQNEVRVRPHFDVG